MAIANFLNQVKASGGKLFLQFGGQGSPFLKELSKLYESEPSLKEFFDISFKAIVEEVPKLDKNIIYGGYDFESWIKNYGFGSGRELSLQRTCFHRRNFSDPNRKLHRIHEQRFPCF